MSKYKNIINFLESIFTILTTLKEFNDTKKINFRCNVCNHINSLTSASYTNKKCKVTLQDFCVNCKKQNEVKLQTIDFTQKIKEQTGHIVKNVDFSTRKVIYVCHTCEKENHTFVCNIQRQKYPGVCLSCQNDSNKLDFNKIQKIVNDHQMTLLTLSEEYKNNKQKLKLICKCGEQYEEILSDIKRDKHCSKCKVQKYKNTCLERYGEDNVSKVPEIYEKIVASSLTRKEFEFPLSKIVVYVMGYEPQAILYLLNREIDPFLDRKIEESDIVVGKDVITFRYTDENNVDHVYFPDIFINKTKHIIEVKSNYTFYKEYLKNYQKFNAVIENNFVLRLMIYNDKKDLYEFICYNKEELDRMFNDINLINF